MRQNVVLIIAEQLAKIACQKISRYGPKRVFRARPGKFSGQKFFEKFLFADLHELKYVDSKNEKKNSKIFFP